MFASIDGEDLGLAYGNRSALFVQLKNPPLAIRDIELALMCPGPELLKKRLLDRLSKCNDLISRTENCIEEKSKKERRSNGKKYCDDNVLRLKNRNVSITNAEAFVTIDYTKERGRRLVVNRNISAGKSLYKILCNISIPRVQWTFS